MDFWTFYLATFGCKVNQYESQSLREAWQKLGGTECDSPAQAQVICVNSCAITAKGERDARNAIFRLRREAPTARLILTGCAARLFEGFQPRPGAHWVKPDLVLPQEEKGRLLQGPWALLDTPDPAQPADGPQPAAPLPERALAARPFPPFSISSFKRARPVLKLQDGCQHRCTYCIVPLTRGRGVSRPAAEALAEARRLLEAGHAEIMLSGVNLRLYGRDASGYGDFWDLLRLLDNQLAPEYAGRARLRISSLEPSQLDARGQDSLAGCRMLCPHLHLSLQHASPTVLKRMGRGHYTAKRLAEALADLRRHWPLMGLGADILTGFPGETEADVALLQDFIQALPLTYAHVFPYSPRPGTAAVAFDGQVPLHLKLERAARLRQTVDALRRNFWQTLLAQPRLLVAADCPRFEPGAEDKPVQGAAQNLGQATRGQSQGGHAPLAHCKGVDQYYTPCFFQIAARLDTIRPETAQADRAALSGLLPARPLRLMDKGLLVEVCAAPATEKKGFSGGE